MAISVDDVYKTVLLILNKEQRGYITPTEFNKIATQVQREIFEGYFQYENKQYRIPDNESEYSDRSKNTDEKIAIFKQRSLALATGIDPTYGTYFIHPADFYKLGTVIYNNREVQRVQENDFLYVDMSPLTKPSENYPIYLYRDNDLYVKPTSIQSGVSISYLKKPADVVWGYTVDPASGGYVYDASLSTDIELHQVEQTEVIIKILMYAGVVIRDPQIVQTAAQMDQQETIQENS
jgi:hypothetical protein